MSHYSVISQVSLALRNLLLEEFSNPLGDPDPNLPINDNEIVFTNPKDTAATLSGKLSLWLYQITENEFVKNQPLVRSNGQSGSNSLGFPPLALNLFYLITPFASVSGNDESLTADHRLLGKTMQVLYDNAIIPLQNSTSGEEVAEELRIVFCRLTLEELTRIWEALQEPYRLSVCYQVRVTRIDSSRKSTHSRIEDRQADLVDVAEQE